MNLAYGQMSLYRIYQTGITGARASSGYTFGLIDQVSQYGIQYAEVGQSILCNQKDLGARLTYANWTYQLIKESSVLGTEIPPP